MITAVVPVAEIYADTTLLFTDGISLRRFWVVVGHFVSFLGLHGLFWIVLARFG